MKTRKKAYYAGALLLIILTIVFFLLAKQNETTIYIGIANPSEDIDLTVKIDGKQIFNDTIAYNPFQMKILKEHFKGGVHELYVYSNKANLTEERYIFLLFDQHILIDYYSEFDGLDIPVILCHLFRSYCAT